MEEAAVTAAGSCRAGDDGQRRDATRRGRQAARIWSTAMGMGWRRRRRRRWRRGESNQTNLFFAFIEPASSARLRDALPHLCYAEAVHSIVHLSHTYVTYMYEYSMYQVEFWDTDGVYLVCTHVSGIGAGSLVVKITVLGVIMCSCKF